MEIDTETKQRPLAITIIGWLFIVAGCVGLAYHATELIGGKGGEAVWILVIRVLAIVGGAFLLRGKNWARWLLVLWLGYHVELSVFHTMFELAIHSLLLAVVVFLLFRAPASVFFQGLAKPAR